MSGMEPEKVPKRAAWTVSGHKGKMEAQSSHLQEKLKLEVTSSLKENWVQGC